MHISFTILGKPQPKQRARKGKSWNGKVVWYTPEPTRRFESAAKVAAWKAIVLSGLSWPLDAQYALHVDAFFPDARGYDWDNTVKSVADGMQGSAYKNDRQLVRFSGGKSIDRANPRTEVRLEVIV